MLPQVNPTYAECDDLEKIHQIHERRQNKPDSVICYERLSLAQKFSASQLTQFGFKLQFIREENSESYAVFICGAQTITVDNSGEISTELDLVFRK